MDEDEDGHTCIEFAMGSAPSRVPPPDGHLLSLRPSHICRPCWSGPFAMHLGLFHSTVVLIETKKADDDKQPTVGGYRYATTWSSTKSRAAAGCVWCQFLLTHLYTPWGNRLNVTVGILGNDHTMPCTPVKTQLLWVAADGGQLTTNIYAYLYTTADDVAASYIIARSPILDVGSARALALARASIDECVHEHDRCTALLASANADSALPTRLVDCTNPARPRLVSTVGQRGSYLALSYVWGEDQPHKTTTANLSSYQTEGLDTLRLPQTIRDAIHIAHALGFQYLWLDTLCIIQDSDEDKRHELALMHRIYRDAFLTIVAASATKVSEGFLQERAMAVPHSEFMETDLPDLAVPFICPPSSHNAPTGSATDDAPTRRVGTVHLSPLFSSRAGEIKPYNHSWEPISTRAWCLQEYLMSPRALLFTSQTLQFRCHTATQNVGGSFYHAAPPTPIVRGERRLPDALFLPAPPPVGWHGSSARLVVYEAWLRVVQDYTRCALSYPADKLPACGALAAEFQRVLRAEYVAGLWRDSLVNDLLWQAQISRDAEGSPRVRQAVGYRAPSWSWAAVEGEVTMRLPGVGQDPLCEVVRCTVQLKDADVPFGQVVGGSIVLRAAVIRCVLRKGGWKERDRMLHFQTAKQARRWKAMGKEGEDEEVKFHKDLYGEVHADWADEAGFWGSKLWAVMISRDLDEDGDPMAVGLVVRRASDNLIAGQPKDVYKRVGYFAIEDTDVLRDLGWNTKDLLKEEIEIL
ncbi:heterokaryon incompatibility protein-domain-containing protein [Trametes gibbosa]|nr:heterokaryon incompatibility protein-domain-containing protein [Trametes gibbosa]